MTADKANELVEIFGGNPSPEIRLAVWLWLKDFVTAAIAEEKERCAKMADDMRASIARPDSYIEAYTNGCIDVAAAIRKGVEP